MRAGLGMTLLGMDLLAGLFFVVLLWIATLGPDHPEPGEGEMKRLRALTAELSARLQVKEGRLEGLVRGESRVRGEDLEQTPVPTLAAEWTGTALLRGAVAELTARHAALQEKLRRSELGLPEQAMLQTKATQAGLTAQIDRLQTEIARLQTRMEESTRETFEARSARVALEARLREQDKRIIELEHERHALASRAGVRSDWPPTASEPLSDTPRPPLPRPRMTQP